jgi:hypothetical protein
MAPLGFTTIARTENTQVTSAQARGFASRPVPRQVPAPATAQGAVFEMKRQSQAREETRRQHQAPPHARIAFCIIGNNAHRREQQQRRKIDRSEIEGPRINAEAKRVGH